MHSLFQLLHLWQDRNEFRLSCACESEFTVIIYCSNRGKISLTFSPSEIVVHQCQSSSDFIRKNGWCLDVNIFRVEAAGTWVILSTGRKKISLHVRNQPLFGCFSILKLHFSWLPPFLLLLPLLRRRLLLLTSSRPIFARPFFTFTPLHSQKRLIRFQSQVMLLNIKWGH